MGVVYYNSPRRLQCSYLHSLHSMKSQLSNVDIVDVYYSSLKSWNIAGYIPQCLYTMDTTFLDGYFYCFTWEDRTAWIHEAIPRILVFSIQDAKEMQMRQMWVEPLPELFVEDDKKMYALISCGSRLLMVSLKDEPNGLVIIWEFHKVSSNPSWRWLEITRFLHFLGSN